MIPALQEGLESTLSDTSSDWSLSYEDMGNVHLDCPVAGVAKAAGQEGPGGAEALRLFSGGKVVHCRSWQIVFGRETATRGGVP